MQGRLDKGYKVLPHINQTEKCNLKISNITEKEWLTHYDRLWTEEQLEEIKFSDINERVEPTAMDESALQCCKNRKSPVIDGLNFKFIKYAPAYLNSLL